MLTYILVAPILYLLSYLPTDALYKLSDALAFVLRDVIGYRKDVVFKNLRNSFPEKSEAELKQIAHKSYSLLADRVVENIKSISVKEDEFLRRCTMDAESLAMVNHYYNQGRDIVVMLAHAGQWEFAGYTASTLTPYTIYGVYSQVTNKYFNDLVVKTRGKLGMKLISMKDTSKYFSEKKDERTLHIFFTDQSPSNPANSYWTTFLNQDTGFFYGGARYAIKHNCVPVYITIKQEKRGYSQIHLQVIKEDVSNTSPDELVQLYSELLEKQIRSNPADWLWSHKRWKRQRPADK